MTDEPDNTPDEGVTDNVENSNYDNPEDWDFYDPEEDTEEATETEGTEGEAAETETDDETKEVEEAAEDDAETADDDGEKPPITATKDAVVELADGKTATVGDLIAGNMRQEDYSRKTQEVAQQRTENTANLERIERINQAFVDHLANMVPQEPDPALAYSDPAKYQTQKSQYDAAMGIVQNLIQVGDQSKEMQSEISEADRTRALQEANNSLIMMFPEAGTREGREKFFSGVQDAAEKLGFTADDLNSTTDHRLFALAHWAQKGMAADRAAKSAKAKVDKAPKTPPRKPGQGARKPSGNADAMRKLSKSGSMQDALAVDFD